MLYYVVLSALCEVAIAGAIVWISLQIISFNQRLDALLDIRILCWKSQLTHNLTHQHRVRQMLACLHDAHHRCVDLILTIPEDFFVCLLYFFCTFLCLDGVDLDTEEFVGEVCVEEEDVAIQNVFASVVGR